MRVERPRISLRSPGLQAGKKAETKP